MSPRLNRDPPPPGKFCSTADRGALPHVVGLQRFTTELKATGAVAARGFGAVAIFEMMGSLPWKSTENGNCKLILMGYCVTVVVTSDGSWLLMLFTWWSMMVYDAPSGTGYSSSTHGSHGKRFMIADLTLERGTIAPICPRRWNMRRQRSVSMIERDVEGQRPRSEFCANGWESATGPETQRVMGRIRHWWW